MRGKSGWDVQGGADDDEALRRDADGLQSVADAACERAFSEDEEGDVCAERCADADECGAVEFQMPEMVEYAQYGGGIGTAAAQTAAHGDVFFQPDVCAETAA